MLNTFKKFFSSASLFCVLLFIVFVGISFAGVKSGGANQFTNEYTDEAFGSGVNWNLNQGVLYINGVNWQNITGINLGQVNWTGANINAAQGVNWEALRVANGNTSTSVNWQAFGV